MSAVRPLSIALAFLAAASPVSAKPPAGELTAAGHTTDSLDTVKANLAAGRALLVDVREPREWHAGHVAIAKPLPLSVLRVRGDDAEFIRFVRANISDGLILYTHCRSGKRCLTVAPMLREMGYEVRPLKAGYSELEASGFSGIEPPAGFDPSEPPAAE